LGNLQLDENAFVFLMQTESLATNFFTDDVVKGIFIASCIAVCLLLALCSFKCLKKR